MEYHELNPLIRGRELELLSNETFERMIQQILSKHLVKY